MNKPQRALGCRLAWSGLLILRSNFGALGVTTGSSTRVVAPFGASPALGRQLDDGGVSMGVDGCLGVNGCD